LSSNGRREVITIPLDTLIAELGEVRKYIDALQNQLNQITSELNEVNNSKNFISELKTGSIDEVVIPADRRGYVLARAKPIDRDKVIVHVGLEYYAELPLEKAMEILISIEKDLRNTLTLIQRELNNATNYYQQLQALISKALEQARQSTQATK